ncbi:leucine-rich repeat-containing protein 59-like isoform X1 [Schistocerca nitens]|uniref:leucine-rich repeat-containing protein 59-like isoform X1 n=2 Tax=Schistocerca nitens TaxID=7011 RepID=UPI00211899DA|nr:leucine-rich repeat-containing protein 59-like isoform X1 [Schistocerca nitens]
MRYRYHLLLSVSADRKFKKLSEDLITVQTDKMPGKKLNLRDRLEDDQLDLSMSDLDEVPVREIAQIKKATSLDLSNNRITTLGKNFASLVHLVKIDLSNNFLTELPENFGELVQLKHLDLYNNKLQHLPLSIGQLRNLRWLDLKNNPLVPALAEVVGPCLDAAQCQKAARTVVPFLQNMQVQIAEERERRQQQRRRQRELDELAAQEKKKELQQQQQQQKKKKKASKSAEKIQAKTENGVKHNSRPSQSIVDEEISQDPSTVPRGKIQSKHSSTKKAGNGYVRLIWTPIMLVVSCLLGLSLVSLLSPERYLLFQQSVKNILHPPAAELLWQLTDYISHGILQCSTYVMEFWVWLKEEEKIQEAAAYLISVWRLLCLKVEVVYRTLSDQLPLYIDMVKKKIS